VSREYRVTRRGQREIATNGTEVPVPGGKGWELVGVCASEKWVFWTWTRPGQGPVEPTEIPPHGRRTG